MSEIIRVGMADLNFAKAPDILVTLGLGSCVGAVVYDPVKRIAGMVHAMLPYAEEMRDHANIAKFADTGIVRVVETLKQMGALQNRLIAKIAGGAQMFSFGENNDLLKIGFRNTVSSKEILSRLGIPIIAEETGGSFGRTIEFNVETGILLIKTVGYGSKEI